MILEIKLNQSIDNTLGEEIIKSAYFLDPNIVEIKFENSVFKFTSTTPLRNSFKKKFTEYTNQILSSNLRFKPKTYDKLNIDFFGSYKENPALELIKTGQIIKNSSGVYSFTGEIEILFSKLNSKLKDLIKTNFDVKEFFFPSLIKFESLEKSNYIKQHAHQLNFVNHIEENSETLKNFSVLKNDFKKIKKLISNEMLHCLSPTVCHHLYESFENKTIEKTFLAMSSSKCYRYESKSTLELERLKEFNMTELICIGSKNDVDQSFKSFKEFSVLFLDNLGLKSIFCSANDLFFMENHAKLKSFQLASESKIEGKIYLPYNNNWISSLSINMHNDHFGKSFNIKLKNIGNVNSCCLGFGLERIMLGLLSQYGHFLEKWPKKLKTFLEL